MAELPPDRTAVMRMRRTLYLAIGVAAAIFGIALAPGPNGFTGQIDQLNPVFAWFSLTVTILLPVSFAVLGFLVSERVMKVLVATVAIGFVASQVFWVVGMIPDRLAHGAAPWLQGFGAIPATLLAVTGWRTLVWVFAIAQGPIVAVVGLYTRDDTSQQSLLDGMGAVVTCFVLAGVASAVAVASERQDEVAARARQQASAEASSRTREREQARINAIVHDDIMSVLLAASRVPAPAGLAEQAQRAVDAARAVGGAAATVRTYTPEELVAVLRMTAGEIADDAAFSYHLDSSDGVPSVLVAAFTEATAEAMRNSMLHGGRETDDIRRAVDVTVGPGNVEVIVRDNGRGFNVRQVSERRLGIRVSILGRMRALPGGGASIDSRPGAGTTVSLWWHAEEGT